MRKIVQGPIRDKGKTKQRLLDAVGKILKTKGYSGLMVSKIAAVAGYDKKLIYEYFGSTDKLIDEYLKSKDYWNTADEETANVDMKVHGNELLKLALLSQYNDLRKNKELQKLILWQLSENRTEIKKLFEQKEKSREALFLKSHQKSEEYRAIIAVLEAGIYHLSLCASTNGSHFCGIDTKSDDGRKKIEKAIINILDFAEEKL
ncbi:MULTISPECIES: TetR/AcrR family transcriptional regulator [Chryseobacterium]|uniref:Bacterial regulatory proteins, tetR family n=1 Tax=Chryseobacterium balustinum TaxID=246 RepID=A0AAX2IQY2_9FLAO|nr:MULTISPECIES: TetR/AcrR family transcriptional regulator [Chryseobacterium]AZB28447.1 TetR/AcrR family transcriptional regulator [Chryseobacterium balustinum]OCK49661.1 TetR family transcriptional regulator [Chryseobacterium sp. CBo1]SKC12287.1 transcriptional regulator, TetR family [Chryseobacterium balustinum]SQA92568.1 Bacterial regulatory proteins, tetR family [Chryseobacterium balustinum]